MKNELIAGSFLLANSREIIFQIVRSSGAYLINRVERFTQPLIAAKKFQGKSLFVRRDLCFSDCALGPT